MRTVKFLTVVLLGLLALATARADDASRSLYQLELKLTDQAALVRDFDLYAGQPALVAMFYGSCPMTCPLLIDTLRAIENALTPQERARVRVLMVSVDPDRDTPQALAALAKQRRIDLQRWTLARAEANDVRMLAAALDIQYRRLPNGEYNHTSVITLLGADGEMLKQTAVLGRAEPEFVTALRSASR
jgi:protein SCO1/2